ncbi:MAG TPA: hypothetical protein VK903_07755 [Propionicimonas sp.]|nr:hypothetical protein [Propionicimonas sp.]
MHYAPQYPPPPYYPPPEEYEGPRRRRRRRRDADELEDYLQDLEDEIGRVRRELAAQREPGESTGQEPR